MTDNRRMPDDRPPAISEEARGADLLAKTTAREIAIELVPGDVVNFEADVLVVKYAQEPFGSDKDVTARVVTEHGTLLQGLPNVGETLLLNALGKVAAKSVLVVGVPPQREFDYGQARA